MKRFLKQSLRLLLTPLRLASQRRNGVSAEGERKQLPNEALLGLVREMLSEGHTAVLTVKGYSMRPFLEHLRDKVRLEQPVSLSVGDAVLAKEQGGRYVLHRIVSIEGESLTLMGDGNVRGTERCLKADVCGVVTEYIRPRRTIKASDPSLRRRIRAWRRLLPIRRYLLTLYKATV
ncbi:MAG: S24/S26 family peptidase [Prevotellaceae bacterium]|nr:S24/S26 family peptidase [Prevotellaceae bacterium]MCD8303430.1 S24/S26 family peptidase [Prevotellaceae bacterium]